MESVSLGSKYDLNGDERKSMNDRFIDIHQRFFSIFFTLQIFSQSYLFLHYLKLISFDQTLLFFLLLLLVGGFQLNPLCTVASSWLLSRPLPIPILFILISFFII